MVMDKSNLPPPPPPSSSTSTASSSSLKSLNKSSYKISKQSSIALSTAPASAITMRAPSPLPPPQPPVYNIDKSNFRDVVQKLTGSASHLRPPQARAAAAGTVAPHPPPARPDMAPPPPPPTAIPSRLHRIRPTPLAAPRPTPIPPPALSPLPPLPAVCMSAESPISAYMRRLRGMPSPIYVPTSPLGFGCLPSPRAPPSPGVPVPATSPRVRDP